MLGEPETNGFSAREGAAYSRDMLQSLKRIAVRQGHTKLAELLEAAAVEASRLARASAPGRPSAQ